jgi:hypothetical protein
VIGLSLAFAHGYLLERRWTILRAAPLITVIGQSLAWISLFAFLMGPYIVWHSIRSAMH